ncbi:MAG: ECF-type sigma factor [Pirellulaceae bacterium]
MTGQGSVSALIVKVRMGCESAATKIWARYYPKLLELARLKLSGAARRVADEEDVVVAVFHSFFRRTRRGSYPHLQRRNELWRLLAQITTSKALNLIRREKSQKRGGGRLVTAPLHTDPPHSLIHETFANLASSEPNPFVLAMITDSLDHLLTTLRDEELRVVAIAKLDGSTNEEIAAKIRRSIPTVERRLRLIRDVWREEFSP